MRAPERLAFEQAATTEGEDLLASSVAKPAPLDEDELRAIFQSELSQAVNEETSLIAEKQQQADRFYRGDNFGNEQKGRSSVVLHDLAETIDWMMPVLMRMFFFTANVVRYTDTTPESEAQGFGRNATRSVNELFREQLSGFRVTHDWIKSALMYKIGVIKLWVEEVREPRFHTMNLTWPQVYALLDAPESEVEIVALSAPWQAPDPEFPQQQTEMMEVQVKEWRQTKRVRLETVAPEEFLICRDARTLDDETRFCCHKRRISKGALYSMGVPWDVVASLPQDQGSVYDGRRETRMEDEETTIGDSAYRTDEASQMVMFFEGYMRVDYDGDGYAELRKVWAAGSSSGLQIIGNEIVETNPMVAITPKPMPHKFHGRSVYDDVEDLQRIRSTLMRCMLDNIYLTNAPRWQVLEGEADIDRLLDALPGGVIPVTTMDAIKPLEAAPLSSWVMDTLNYTQEVRENRTGVSRISASTLSSTQNQTAMGVSQVFEAAEARISLVAQIIAECGFRELFRKIPRILKASGMEPSQIRVGDEWVVFDPAMWPDDLRCSVEVGLSPGQTEQRIQRLMLILSLQEKAMAEAGPGFLTDWQKIYNTVAKITEEAGFRNPEIAWTDPQGQQPQPRPPAPEALAAQAQMAQEQAQLKLNAAKLAEKEQYDRRTLDIREREVNLTHVREAARIEMDGKVRMAQIASAAAIERERIAAQLQEAQIGAAAKKAAGAPQGGNSDG